MRLDLRRRVERAAALEGLSVPVWVERAVLLALADYPAETFLSPTPDADTGTPAPSVPQTEEQMLAALEASIKAVVKR